MEYKRFLGSSFLADFTLVICGESHAGEQHAHTEHQQHDSTTKAAAAAAEQEPGTPDTTAAAAEVDASAAVAHSSTAAAPLSTPTTQHAARVQDAPCSGQHHHFPADILPQSPDRASARAGVGPLSAAFAAGTAAVAAASASSSSSSSSEPRSSSASGLKPLVTHSTTTSSSMPARPRQPGAADSSSVIVMPVHGVVLAAASPYWETLLRDWACDHQQLQMVVGDDQLPAAQQLLSFIYTGALAPSGVPQADLLQLLLLADRFDVARAVTAARRALASLSPECIEWVTLVGVWGLPQHLYEGEGDEAAALRGVAWERLLQLFGDLEEAWASADGRAMWQQLPWRALSALVASDSLAVASENTTFAAVSSWIAHQQHQQHLLQQQLPGSTQQPRPTPQELQQLAASIRIPALGPCYLSYVAMQQDSWFAAAVDTASLARAAAFAAAAPEVRKDLMEFTATSTAAAMQAASAAAAAAAAAAPSHQAGGCTGYSSGSSAAGGGEAVAAAAGGAESNGLGAAAAAAGQHNRCSSYGGGGSLAAAGAGAGGCGSSAAGCSSGSSSSAIELRMQLMSLAQAMQRPRSVSSKRAGQFAWRVDLAAIRSLYDDVAAAGSRDSRILRSPAHSFAGYEWALQLEVTQTRGATGFDVTKPWSLGVFLTCQVRLEQPAHGSSSSSSSGPSSLNSNQQAVTLLGSAAVPGQAAAGAGSGGAEAAAAGSDSAAWTRRISSGSSGSGIGGAGLALGAGSSSGADGKGVGRAGSPAPGAAAAAAAAGAPQQQLVMQLLDFGFVSTSATIAVREAGSSSNKRTEKSWEHAVVRYRASWGWPNYLDQQAVGWDEGMFLRWLIDGQLHLSARVRVLG